MPLDVQIAQTEPLRTVHHPAVLLTGDPPGYLREIKRLVVRVVLRHQVDVRAFRQDPVLRHFPDRKSVGYFGAVRVRDGLFVSMRESEKFNAWRFHEFMKRLLEVVYTLGRKMVLITDNARYHHARRHKEWREEQTEHFILDYLPPYSPDLNPVEREWKLLRRICLHNRYFHTLKEIEGVVETRFLSWSLGS